MDTAQIIAKSLLEIGAIGFSPQKPITFKTGIISPVYVDNRRLPFHPDAWHEVIRGFDAVLKAESIEYDVIAGIETAGIPHSAALSFVLQQPSVFVRKKVKDHGTKSRVEGGSVSGKKVLLIEDHVTTGASSLAGVEALRAEGAIVEHCLAITSYEFPEEKEQFTAAKVHLHTLTNFSVILEEALKMGKFAESELATIQAWLANPREWKTRT